MTAYWLDVRFRAGEPLRRLEFGSATERALQAISLSALAAYGVEVVASGESAALVGREEGVTP